MKQTGTFLAILGFIVGFPTLQAASSGATTLPDGIRISVVLKTTVSAADSKPGTPVVMEVTEDVKGPKGQVLIPAGAKLKGRITKAVPWSKERKESSLALVAERAEWKDGAATLRAFIVGKLHVLNGALGAPAGSGPLQGAEVIEGPNSPPPSEEPSTRALVDSSARLRLAAEPEPEVVTEVYSTANGVQMDAGSTFALKTTPAQ